MWSVVCGGPPCPATLVLVVLCCAVCSCAGALGRGVVVVVVLENVGELLCGWRVEARVSRCGTTRDGRAGVGLTAGICTGGGAGSAGTTVCGSGMTGDGAVATGCSTTAGGAGAGSRFTTINAIAVASTAPRTNVITGFMNSPVC
jgi:hypothetical protein